VWTDGTDRAPGRARPGTPTPYDGAMRSGLGFRARWAMATVALASGAFGCGDHVCIDPVEDGVCPDRADAESLITCAGGDVRSVDSEPELVDGLCCYEATRDDGYYVASCVPRDQPTGTGSGTSTGTGTSTCDGCGTAATTGDPSRLCSESGPLYDALGTCMCLVSCADECGDDGCIGIVADDACQTCVTASCSSELSACFSDP
jgi:hypothetical protein